MYFNYTCSMEYFCFMGLFCVYRIIKTSLHVNSMNRGIIHIEYIVSIDETQYDW